MAADGDVRPPSLGLSTSGTPRQSHSGAPIRESAENTHRATSEGSSGRKEVIYLKMLLWRFLLNKLEHRKVAIKVKNRDLYQVQAIAASLQLFFYNFNNSVLSNW